MPLLYGKFRVYLLSGAIDCRHHGNRSHLLNDVTDEALSSLKLLAYMVLKHLSYEFP